MTDTELRDRLKSEGPRRMAEARPSTTAPPLLERRVRSRQAATVIGALVTVIAVAAVSLVAVRVALRHHPPATTSTVTGPEGDRTTFLYGTRVRYPRDWSLVELPGTGKRAGLFQLSNFGPRRAATVGCARPASGVPPGGVLLTVAQDTRSGTGVPHWPVELRAAGDGCFDARWSMRGRAFEASMVVGTGAGRDDRQDMLQAYHSIRFPPALSPGLPGTGKTGRGGPAFVVTSGYVVGRPASWVATGRKGGVCLDDVVGSGPSFGPCRPVHLQGTVGVLGTGPWATVVGTVSPEVDSVQAVLAGGQTVVGEIVPAPPFLHAAFDFFVVELPIQSRGEVVAKDTRGNEIGQRPFDSPPLPVVAHGGVPGKRWLLLDREQSNGIRCIDFDRGFGDQGTICPTAVPASRDIQASVMPLSNQRKLVVGVASRRVAYVQVQFLNARFVPGRLISIPKAFVGEGTLLPAAYSVFTVPIGSTDGALVVAFDRSWNPIDGLPLGTAGGFGD